jgi:hypothetical protein
MGQAKRRAAEEQKWIDSLTESEREIVATADALIRRFLEPLGATGMCYRMTFFQHLYLAEKGIGTVPVVGYVNDGTDDVMISHAWLEYNGKKTDVTLFTTANAELNRPGPISFLDRIVRNGHAYTYHLDQTPPGLAAEIQFLRDPRAAEIINQKRAEHAAMLGRAKDASVMRIFLDFAPDGFTFCKIKAVVESLLAIKPH